VVGLLPVVPTPEELAAAREIQWGDDLVGEALERANREMREHFAGLHLIEIEVEPRDCHVEWGAITQPIAGKPSSEWQVPWDERLVGNGQWAFFLHFVQINEPLQTSLGPIQLPAPTSIPPHLARIQYDLPS
jgi:hypothetical protein